MREPRLQRMGQRWANYRAQIERDRTAAHNLGASPMLLSKLATVAEALADVGFELDHLYDDNRKA